MLTIGNTPFHGDMQRSEGLSNLEVALQCQPLKGKPFIPKGIANEFGNKSNRIRTLIKLTPQRFSVQKNAMIDSCRLQSSGLSPMLLKPVAEIDQLFLPCDSARVSIVFDPHGLKRFGSRRKITLDYRGFAGLSPRQPSWYVVIHEGRSPGRTNLRSGGGPIEGPQDRKSPRGRVRADQGIGYGTVTGEWLETLALQLK